MNRGCKKVDEKQASVSLNFDSVKTDGDNNSRVYLLLQNNTDCNIYVRRGKTPWKLINSDKETQHFINGEIAPILYTVNDHLIYDIEPRGDYEEITFTNVLPGYRLKIEIPLEYLKKEYLVGIDYLYEWELDNYFEPMVRRVMLNRDTIRIDEPTKKVE
ncbi:MAG: hypothetical protein ACK5NT_01435 [Pyrinomonadaceae bacterium]